MMCDWEIRPFVGVGPLEFGMTRDSVRRLLKEKPRVIVKHAGYPPIEQFPESGLQAHYDGQDQLEMVEFYPEVSTSFRGVELLGRSLDDVRRDLERVGLSGIDDGLGDLTYDDFGFGLYAEGDDVTSVGVFSREYANRELAGGGA
jgi:hypothetical protein